MEAAAPRSSFSAPSFPSSFFSCPPCRSPATLRPGRSLQRRRPLSLRALAAPDGDAGRPDPVEVIGIGSRKDAFIDFCLGSPSSSSRFRFWTIHKRDSLKVQLLQRYHGADMILKNLEYPLSVHSCPPAAILVASAGNGFDHITAIELLNSVKSAGGLAVAILLEPFRFEGQRRQEEVDDLVSKFQECSHFYIVLEADSLLKAEVETLAVALESANHAVFLAINTVYIMMSEMHLKFLYSADGEIKEVKPSEVVKLVERYGEAKVGFGAGYNIKAAITQAVFHCPFVSGGLKDLNGLVIFTLTSACAMDESDLMSTIHNFRQLTECRRDIIFSRIHEPDLEPNLIVTTVLIVGCNGKMVSQKSSFLSGLVLHFPFFFSLLGRDHPERTGKPTDKPSVDSSSIKSVDPFNPSNIGTMSNLDAVKDSLDYINVDCEEMETEPCSRESGYENKRRVAESSDISYDSVSEDNAQTSVEPGFEREQHKIWNIGPGFQIAQLWAKERASLNETDRTGKINIFTLPVGVKSSELYPNCSSHVARAGTSDETSSQTLDTINFPSRVDISADSGLETIMEIYNSALTLLKRRNMDESRKRGFLSTRAASMLESERDSQKSWTPTMEMQYRGGTYKGRCQGGIPEGKGRLTFSDGSFYDGMWRCGKRFGLGTFCYSNGDVYQGAWRDDLMHGKGWFYFHTGDRWFVNFWKGKPNGEGRFYSKDGSIFFGHFQNGWRHGESLRIDVDGSRWTEIWDEGVLVSRTQLQKEAQN